MPGASGALSGAASGAATGTMILPGWGTAIGAVVGGIGGMLAGQQSAPTAAQYQPVNVGQVAANTTNANLQNLGASEQLSAQTNQFNESQQLKLLNTAIPGYSQAQSSLMSLFNTQLNNATNGTLSKSTQSMIAQYAAENGVSRGTSGQFNGFDLTKDFGVNLEQYQQQQSQAALGTLSSVYGMSPAVSPMSPSASFITPGQALSVAQTNNGMSYNATQAGYNASAAASNYNASLLGGAVSNIGSAVGATLQNTVFKPNTPLSQQAAQD